MPTLVLDPPPPGFEALIESRRRSGADRFDEVWQGVLHMAPVSYGRHALLQAQLLRLLGPFADAAGLLGAGNVNVGEPEDYRIPDAVLLRPGPDTLFYPTVALAIEIVSPGDESWKKLGFYAAHRVEELLIVDPQVRSVDWLALAAGEYGPSERSALVDLDRTALAQRISWPAVSD